MPIRTYLVTGGAGFIGSNIVATLLASQEARVVVCDRLRTSQTGKWLNLRDQAIADWVPPESLWPWLEQNGDTLHTIIHMGAISSTTESDVDLILSNNFALSRDLFKWCRRAGVRLIYASSAATYGAGELGFDDKQDLAHLTALRPLNPYGWSKALFDIYCAREADAGQEPPGWVGLKFFNVFGPNEAHKGSMKSVLAHIWPDLASGRPVKLFASDDPRYPDGGQMRDFVYVKHAAQCVAWLTQNRVPNGVYNFGTGKARTFAELAESAFAALDRPPKIEYISAPDSLRGRYQYFTEARMERLRSLGWDQPPPSLEDAVKDYVQTHLRIGGAG